MPRGIYPRKKKGRNAKPGRRKPLNLPKLLDQLRTQREALIEQVTAVGTAIEALEAVEA